MPTQNPSLNNFNGFAQNTGQKPENLRDLAKDIEDAERFGDLEIGLFDAKCFAAGTPIVMAGGTKMPIEKIKIGDRVAAFDGLRWNGRGGLEARKVTRLFSNVTDEWLILRASGSQGSAIDGLTVTPGHRFLAADGGFRRIDEILADDARIVLADGTFVAVSAERIVYNAGTAHLYEEAEIVEQASAAAYGSCRAL